jgi:hypothetical protein
MRSEGWTRTGRSGRYVHRRDENASTERIDAECGKETSGYELAAHQLRSTRGANGDI